MYVHLDVLVETAKEDDKKPSRLYNNTTRRVGRDPFLRMWLLGGDPPVGYLPRGMRVEDVACDDDVVQNILQDIG